MNFNSIFEELSKLYEEDAKKAEQSEEKVEEACKEALTEAADEDEVVEDEILVDEEPVEEPVVEEEPKRVILECDKCGALVIKDEADVVVDESTDLVNVEDECQFCEETAGYKIVGVVAPYEAPEEVVDSENFADAEEPIEEDEIVEESVEVPAEEAVLVEESVEAELAETDEEDLIDEGISDWYRKKFDKPASTETQIGWEETLIDLQLALEHETNEKKKTKIMNQIKEIEDLFARQRDWEARHNVNR